MAWTIRVKQGCRIAGPLVAGCMTRMFVGGEVIGEDVLSRRQMQMHLDSGHAEPVNIEGATPLPDVPVANPPGTEGIVPLPVAEINERTAQAQGTMVRVDKAQPILSITSPGGVTVSSKPVAPIQTVDSLWVLDPAALAGQSLEALNVMVQERDKGVLPFETTEEAVAFLSKDFKPAR